MVIVETSRVGKAAWLVRVEPDEWLSRRDEMVRGKSITARIASRLGSRLNDGDYIVLTSMHDDDRELLVATVQRTPLRIMRKDNQIRVQPTFRVDMQIHVSPDDIAGDVMLSLTCDPSMQYLDRSESDVVQPGGSCWATVWKAVLDSSLLTRQLVDDMLFVRKEKRACFDVLVECLRAANEQNSYGWALLLFPDALELHVGSCHVLTLRSGWFEHAAKSTGGSLDRIHIWNRDAPSKRREILDTVIPILKQEGSATALPPDLKQWHSAALVKTVSDEYSMLIENPAYWSDTATVNHQECAARAFICLAMAMSLPKSLFAFFYTGLQAKPFVILSGTSGTGKTKLAQHFAELLPSLSTSMSNHLFLSVRPDWRDSKALLGYYNPLTESYAWTPFLRFLERAARSYEARDGLAWFVVLDEMNLAHVEYYFADLLSVMESGRDEDGWTREALVLVYPETAEGDLPQREMRLPPNLYVVGTVNIDETTHAFSPKVLDRAFSIELVDVDFSDYPPAVSRDVPELTDAERQALLAAFTRNGRFPRIDKVEIAEYVAAHPEVRDRLQALNVTLRQDNLHFGYRVFDEIVTFLVVAEKNGMFDGLGENAAFDAAVLMKVLPKLHGSRGKLERPLRNVLAWCLVPDDPQPIMPVQAAGREADPLAQLRTLDYALPKTAERVQRMLAELQIDGFTAFG